MATSSVSPAGALPIEVPEPPPRSLLRDAWDELRALAGYRHLLRYLTTSSLRTENANTVLGFLWWILDPLLQMAVYVLLVKIILNRGGPDFAIFILTAIVAWELFAKGTGTMVSATVQKERSMQQIPFPKVVLPLSAMIAASIRFAFAFAVLLLIAIPFGFLPSPVAILAVPVMLVQIIFSLGVGFFLSAFNIFFRDTAKFMRYLFRIGFYLSPTLYPVSMVPERFRGIYELNPFATLIPAYREVVMVHAAPDFGALGLVAIASVVVLILGYLFFVRLEPWFAKLV